MNSKHAEDYRYIYRGTHINTYFRYMSHKIYIVPSMNFPTWLMHAPSDMMKELKDGNNWNKL